MPWKKAFQFLYWFLRVTFCYSRGWEIRNLNKLALYKLLLNSNITLLYMIFKLCPSYLHPLPLQEPTATQRDFRLYIAVIFLRQDVAYKSISQIRIHFQFSSWNWVAPRPLATSSVAPDTVLYIVLPLFHSWLLLLANIKRYICQFPVTLLDGFMFLTPLSNEL